MPMYKRPSRCPVPRAAMSLRRCTFALLSFAALAACTDAHLREGSDLYLDSRHNVCTIASSYASSNDTEDDSPAVQAAFAQCARDSVIVFSDGVD